MQKYQLINDIHVKVFKHPTLNQSKGIIRCKDIIVASDEEIKEGLKDQHVGDIYRIKRRDGESLVALLSSLLISVNFRRCFNYQRYGHGAKFCKKEQDTCGNCFEPQHIPAEYVNPILCPNCLQQHAAWDRKCQIFQQELKIQQI